MAYPGSCIYQLSQDGIDRVAYRTRSTISSPGGFWKPRSG